MYNELNQLQQLCYDTYFGKVSKYSAGEAEDVIRKAFLDELPALPKRKAEMERYLKNNAKQLFALLEENITPIANRLTLEAFSDLVKVDTIDLGDAPVYRVKNKKLFPVSQIATGVGATHRRRMHDSKLETDSFTLTAFIYEEAFEFLTGKISWTDLCNRVAESFAHKIATLVTSTIFAAYDNSGNPFHVQTNAEGLETALEDLLQRVEGATGVKCQILGTKGALAKVPNSGGAYLQEDARDRRDFGYVKIFDSNECRELPQYYDEDNKKFEIPTDTLLVVPAVGEPLAYCCLEGDIRVLDNDNIYNRKDRQIEFEMERQLHVGVAISSKFGMVKITA